MLILFERVVGEYGLTLTRNRLRITFDYNGCDFDTVCLGLTKKLAFLKLSGKFKTPKEGAIDQSD